MWSFLLIIWHEVYRSIFFYWGIRLQSYFPLPSPSPCLFLPTKYASLPQLSPFVVVLPSQDVVGRRYIFCLFHSWSQSVTRGYQYPAIHQMSKFDHLWILIHLIWHLYMQLIQNFYFFVFFISFFFYKNKHKRRVKLQLKTWNILFPFFFF